MKAKTLPVLFTTASLLLTACSGDNKKVPEDRRVRTAPMSEKQTGVITRGLELREVHKLLEKESGLKVRVLNEKHGLYEFFGASENTLKSLIDDENVTVERNHFIPDKKRKENFKADIQHYGFLDFMDGSSDHPLVVTMEMEHRIRLTGELLDFVSTCQLDSRSAPQLDIESSHGMDRTNAGVMMNLGETLHLSSAGSTAFDGSSALQYVWLVTGPEHTNLPPMAYGGNLMAYEPDAMGPHLFSIVAKDARGVCNLAIGGFYVTANEPYDPSRALDDSLADHVDPQYFWHIFHVNAQQAWSISSGQSLLIAIIDTGVDYNHPAIARNIAVNRYEIPGNNVDDDNNGFVDDYVGYDFGQDDGYPFDDFGHGTHVAGIAASNIFGAARHASILPLKYSAGFGQDLASIAAAIVYAVDRGANIINMSLGWHQDVAAIRYAMQYAAHKGVLVVAAAGNGDENGIGYSNDDKPSYPANYEFPNVISVAATDEHDQLTPYSNFGQTVHLAAPGGTDQIPIVSAYMKNPRGAEYVGFPGTSMASPLVAGVAAQVWAANTQLTAPELRDVLLMTSRKAPALRGRILSEGVVDAMAALNYVLGTGLQ